MLCSQAVQMLSEASETEHFTDDHVQQAQEETIDVNTKGSAVRCIVSLSMQTDMLWDT